MTQESQAEAEIAAPDLASPLARAVELGERGTLAMVRGALRRRAVRLAFQPVVLSRNPGQVAFHEALIRVLDQTGRVIPAAEFIGAVETDELGRILDCLALEMGLGALAADPGLRLSVNMSARSIAYPRWSETLGRGLAQDPAAGERLILEITEASAMTMPDVTAIFMRSVRSRGVSFALDDFGSGHTSFRYLRDFTFDAIKIDGMFIRGIEDSADNQCLTRALVSIATQFDMFTVAETVETAGEAAALTALGVHCQQGYFHGAPSLTLPARTAQRRAAGR